MVNVTLRTFSGDLSMVIDPTIPAKSQIAAFLASKGHSIENLELVPTCRPHQSLGDTEGFRQDITFDVYNVMPMDDNFRNHLAEEGFRQDYFVQVNSGMLIQRSVFGGKY